MGLDVEEGRKPLQLPGATEPPIKSKPGKTPERAARGDWLLAFFRLVNVITISCAALCCVADCMALVARGKPEVTLSSACQHPNSGFSLHVGNVSAVGIATCLASLQVSS